MGDEVDDLLTVADRPSDAPLGPRDIVPFDAFVLWSKATQILPGRIPCLSASDFYRHFVWWCERESITLAGTVTPQKFGRQLCGYLHLRHVERKKRSVYCLDFGSVEYFREWLSRYPSPPPGQGPFAEMFIKGGHPGAQNWYTKDTFPKNVSKKGTVE